MSVAGSYCASFEDVIKASQRLNGVAHKTPVITSSLFDELTHHQVFFKCENLQRSGSFKFRGAYNRLAQLTEEERRKGVVAFSSGNHAQGIALASKILGIHSVLVMPQDVPPCKLDATAEYGAEVVLYDRLTMDREKVAADISAKRNGLTMIPPFNDPSVVAGQGTIAVEFLEQVGQLDVLLIPIGGGGMIGGCAVAAKALQPSIHIIGVEAEGADSMKKSLEEERIVTISPPSTIADGIRTQTPGTLTFPIVKDLVDKIVLVSDTAIVRALQYATTRLKMVLEPTGAVAMAAVMSGLVPAEYKRVGIVLCGGNVDPAVLARFLIQKV